ERKAERVKSLRQRFPCVADLRRRAKWRVPHFAFESVDGGLGEDVNMKRNRDALDAVEIIPRIGLDVRSVDTGTEPFGHHYAAPIGVAPMGLGNLMWPHAERILAAAAQKARLPYTLATPGGAAIEDIARLAPDAFWFQLYAVSRDLSVSFDLVRRADVAGAHVLLVTMDTPVRAKRPRELRNNLVLPFHLTARTVLDAATAPLDRKSVV